MDTEMTYPYTSNRFTYSQDPFFDLRFGVLDYFVHKYYKNHKANILELACGDSPALKMNFNSLQIEYLGIDKIVGIVQQNSLNYNYDFMVGDIESTEIINIIHSEYQDRHADINILIWLGTYCQMDQYASILDTYYSILKEGALFLFDYWNIPEFPEDPAVRFKDTKFRVLEWCKLEMPLMNMSKTVFTTANRRVLGVAAFETKTNDISSPEFIFGEKVSPDKIFDTSTPSAVLTTPKCTSAE